MTASSLRVLTALFAAVFPVGLAVGQVLAPALTAPLPPVPHKHASNLSAPSGGSAAVTKEDLKQLNEIMQHMGQKDRKQFIKAVKQLTPEGRKRLIEGMRRPPVAAPGTHRTVR